MNDGSNDPAKTKTRPQVERFRELARMIGASESEEEFDRALRKVGSAKPAPNPKPPSKSKPRKAQK